MVSRERSVNNNGTNQRKRSINKTPFVNGTTIDEDTMHETSDIPKFDLAGQIMAEHRKITAVRRKGPAKNAKAAKKLHPAELIARKVATGPIVYGPQQIIAEIVARDIENFCIGNATGFQL